MEDERDKTISELRRANKRLSGALDIVLGTIDAQDVPTLFNRTLEKIAETMDADGTIAYLAEADGFHLRGASSALEGARIPHYMAFGRAIETLATRAGHGLRLSVRPLHGASLREGPVAKREVVVVDTGEVRELSRDLLPPFACFIAVPVWFGGRLIAIIEVGWRSARTMREDDVALLDSVANYLSMQLMAAFTEMRARYVEALDRASAKLRERMLEMGAGKGNGVIEGLDELFASAAERLRAHAFKVEVASDGVARACFEDGGEELPCTIDELVLERLQGDVAVLSYDDDAQLAHWLEGLGKPSVGALVDAGELLGARRCYLLLRPWGAEPIDADEQAFLVRFAQDARDAALGEEEREEQVRISQALQMGMKSELQQVPGISAQGTYTSATASALVGGDFYDLVRLPGRRACVIMGDVSGKGVEAASMSAAVRTSLAAYAWEGLPPARMVRSLNDFLLGFSRLETFATLFVGVIDLDKATLRYCSAGHPPALLVRANTGEADILGEQSPAVGAFKDVAYRDGSVKLREGDVLVLYTDGSTEARNPQGAFFGEDGLRETVMRETRGSFKGLLDRILAALDEFTGNRLEDDVALCALRFDSLGPATR